MESDIFSEADEFDLEAFLHFASQNEDFYNLLVEWLDYYRTMRFDLNDFVDFVATLNIDFYETLLDWLNAFEKTNKKGGNE